MALASAKPVRPAFKNWPPMAQPDDRQTAQSRKPPLVRRQRPERRKGLGPDPDGARFIQDMQALAHELEFGADLAHGPLVRMNVDPVDLGRAAVELARRSR